MIETIYIEEDVRGHPRTRAICDRLPQARTVLIRRYGEVFNRSAQDFRLQKRRPALILARKHSNHVLEAPAGYGIGHARNYYFSHMLNCLYDCRYCFLQGMFRSAHYVVFVNYEDLLAKVAQTAADLPGTEEACFFSGYDCDSLALDGITGFCEAVLPFFAKRPRTWLELRTKSTRIEALLRHEPLTNCVVAFSFTPQVISSGLERGVPSVRRRIRAMQELQRRDWRLGLRFDPLIYCEGWQDLYRGLFDDVLDSIDPETLHSVSLGPFRLPRDFHRRLTRLYPRHALFASAAEEREGTVSYPERVEREMISFCSRELERRVPRESLFPCQVAEFRAVEPASTAPPA